ncbi:MAG: hypothetical protein QM755_24175 [Luteolibacter sp.]
MTASRNLVVLAALALAVGPAGAAPSPQGMPSGDPVTDEISRLGDDNFRVREEATKKLWNMGPAIMPRLQEAAKSSDPEVVKRASYLLRRIDYDISPDTPQEITDLVDKFSKAQRDQKLRLIYELRQQRAWRQILKLYAREADSEIRSQIRPAVDGAAVNAARESLVAGRTAEARALLELNPADSQGLLALADFHRSQGTLKAELAKDHAPAGASRALWELALYRVSGDLPMARAAAAASKEDRIEAVCALLDGDPLPWLDAAESTEGPASLRDIYRNLAEKRWRGGILTAQDLEVFEPYARGGDEGSRTMAANCLFLLGQAQLAEGIFSKISPIRAFRYYDSLERLADAYKVLGLDPKKPDLIGWVTRNFQTLGEDGDQPEEKQGDLVTVAAFLEHRGMMKELAAYDAPLAKLAENDPDTYMRFLSQLLTGPDPEEGGGQGAVSLVKRSAVAYAKDDDGKWSEILGHLFSEASDVEPWWEWLGHLDAKASRADRLDALFALFRTGNDPKNLRDRWLKLAWADIGGLPKMAADEKVRMLAELAMVSHDLPTGLKAWEASAPEEDPDGPYLAYLWYLSAAGQWEKCADAWMKIVAKQPGRAEFRAYAAASLRHVGRNSEAAAQDAWAEKLTLADAITCVRVGHGYAFGGDFSRAAQWWERAYLVAQPGSEAWSLTVQLNAVDALDKGDWKRAAALHEVIALSQNGYESLQRQPGLKLRVRITADYCRAFSRLKTEREASIAILQQCHRTLGPDGALADYFFPGLRKAGLIEQHDAWFDESWQALMPIIKAYPACDNTRNTAAWLAARATRHLDEAAEIEDAALASNPQQAAYLDTRAEIQFARKDRKGALEWSAKTLSADPLQGATNPLFLDLRRQVERFRSAPFP